MIFLVRKFVVILTFLFFGASMVCASMVDLMYLPKYGSLEVDMEYTNSNKSFSNRNINSRIINREHDESVNTASVKASYSPFNELKVGVGVDYQVSGTDDQTSTSGGTTTTIEQSGLTEAAILGRFRVLKEKQFGFDLDGVLNISPSFNMGEEGVSGRETSARRGGGLYSGTLLAGKKWEDFSIRANIGVDYNGERELEDVTTGLKTKTYDSRIDFTVGAFTQLKFSEMQAVEGGVEYINIGENTETHPISGLIVTEDSYTIIALTAGYKGEFIKDFLMGYLNFKYHKISDYNVNTSGGLSENIDSSETFINAGAIIKF